MNRESLCLLHSADSRPAPCSALDRPVRCTLPLQPSTRGTCVQWRHAALYSGATLSRPSGSRRLPHKIMARSAPCAKMFHAVGAAVGIYISIASTRMSVRIRDQAICSSGMLAVLPGMNNMRQIQATELRDQLCRGQTVFRAKVYGVEGVSYEVRATSNGLEQHRAVIFKSECSLTASSSARAGASGS